MTPFFLPVPTTFKPAKTFKVGGSIADRQRLFTTLY